MTMVVSKSVVSLMQIGLVIKITEILWLAMLFSWVQIWFLGHQRNMLFLGLVQSFEYRHLTSATSEILWIQALLSELQLKSNVIPLFWCDNQGAIALASNPVYHAEMKHVELNFDFIKEKVLATQINICYIPSADQTTDIFTKTLSYDHCHYL